MIFLSFVTKQPCKTTLSASNKISAHDKLCPLNLATWSQTLRSIPRLLTACSSHIKEENILNAFCISNTHFPALEESMEYTKPIYLP